MTAAITLKQATAIAREAKTSVLLRHGKDFRSSDLISSIEVGVEFAGLSLPATLYWDGHDLRSVERIARGIYLNAVKQ